MNTFAEFKRVNEFTTQAVVNACIMQAEQSVLLDGDSLPPKFFDLLRGWQAGSPST